MKQLWSGVVVVGAIAAAAAVVSPAQVASAAPASTTCAPPAAAASANPQLSAIDDLPSFADVTPRRIVDTRSGLGGVSNTLEAQCTLRLDIAEAGLDETAGALALSVTAVAHEEGFVSAYPCANGLPLVSNLNPQPGGHATPNLVIVEPDVNGMVCLYTERPADLIVDVFGWFTDEGDSVYLPISTERLFDSRETSGGFRVNGDSVVSIDSSDLAPPGAVAAVVNFTASQPVGAGHAAIFPCRGTEPLVSNLNFVENEDRAVGAIVGLGDGGNICVKPSTHVHLIVDVVGFYVAGEAWGPTQTFTPVASHRIVDTRTDTGQVTRRRPADSTVEIRPLAEIGGVGANASGAVLNVTVTDPSEPGHLTIYPCDEDQPTTSSINYAEGQTNANLVVADLAANGRLCIYSHGETELIVDVFGVISTSPNDSAEDLHRLRLDRPIWPPYDSAATDYAVECGEGEQTLTMEIDAFAGRTVRVNGVLPRQQPVDVPVTPNTLTTITITGRGSDRSIHLRCMPPSFPALDVEGQASSPGWFLTEINNEVSGDHWIVILNEYGAPVWYKQVDQQVVGLLRRSDGRVLVTQNPGPFGIDPDVGYRVMSVSGTFIRYETTEPNPIDPVAADRPHPTDHHEYVQLPDGGRALFTYPLVRNIDLTPLGEGFFVDDTVADGAIQELDSDDNVLWTWYASDHFDWSEATYAQRFGLYPSEPNGGEVDIFHLNSMQRLDDGDYIVSARHLDAAFRVDRATGDVEWILGSLPVGAPNKSGAPRLAIVGDPLGGPLRQHDARLNGRVLTLFDNRANTPDPSRVVAYEIDPVAETATLLWQIEAPGGGTADGLGSVRSTGDGTVLVGWGPLVPQFTEHDLAGDLIWRVTQTGGPLVRSYRVVKEPPSAFSASVLRATAGGFAEVP